MSFNGDKKDFIKWFNWVCVAWGVLCTLSLFGVTFVAYILAAFVVLITITQAIGHYQMHQGTYEDSEFKSKYTLTIGLCIMAVQTISLYQHDLKIIVGLSIVVMLSQITQIYQLSGD